MYGDRVGARIGLLYYCFLSATMVVLLRENNFEGCWGSALETSGTLCTQLRFTCRGGAGNSKFSIQALIKQEPLTPPKVASVHNCFSTGGGPRIERIVRQFSVFWGISKGSTASVQALLRPLSFQEYQGRHGNAPFLQTCPKFPHLSSRIVPASMLPIAIHADRALTPFEEIPDAVIVIQGSKISAVGPRGKVAMPRGAREIAAKGKTIVPGFVDVHIHGAGGHDVMEGTPEGLEIIAATVAAHGTTSMVATTVTASEMETCRSVADIAKFILAEGLSPARELSAEIAGIHFEGPFISPARRGVHPAEWIAAPSPALLLRFLE